MHVIAPDESISQPAGFLQPVDEIKAKRNQRGKHIASLGLVVCGVGIDNAQNQGHRHTENHVCMIKYP